MTFYEDIEAFFGAEGIGFDCRDLPHARLYVFENGLNIMALPLVARTHQEAIAVSSALDSVLDGLRADGGCIVLVEDRWRSDKEGMKLRILAHLGRFRTVFARKCSLRRITRPEADAFLSAHHSYGSAAGRHCYGLFAPDGELTAVAMFSNARRWMKDGAQVSSYEWVRYASLPGTRVVGGMGRMLSAFVQDYAPDDVMSYADREWSDGEVYASLGFVREGRRSPITFSIDPSTWIRTPLRSPSPDSSSSLLYQNFGSVKWRHQAE